MNIRRLASLLCFVCGLAAAQAQQFVDSETLPRTARKAWEKGIERARAGQLDEASALLEKALVSAPDFVDALFALGNVRYDQGRLDEAEKLYEQALALAPDYKADFWYNLALTEMKLRKFDEAQTHFERFLSMNPRSRWRRDRAQQHLEHCRRVAPLYAHPVPFEPYNLGPGINTPEAEYLPSLTADEAVLVYTAVRRGQEDFYMSRRDSSGQWGPGQPISSLNTRLNEGSQSISADGRLLVFAACNRDDGQGRCDIYFSEKILDRWTPPRNMGPPVNTRAWESQPSISADGQRLFFTARKEGGLGASDIWMSERRPDGSWGEPRNLGAPINTSGDEQSPFIHPDGRTLYFKSNGHDGLGGYDLYVSRLQADGSWSEPQNLGYPINTEANEGSLVVSLDGRTAYFDSDRADLPGHMGSYDLYAFELYEAARPLPVTYVRGTVRDARTDAPLQARVEVYDLGGQRLLARTTADLTGSYLLCLPAGARYAFHAEHEGYLFYSDHFDLDTSAVPDKPYRLDIRLQPLEGGRPATGEAIALRNIFFDFGSATLRPESEEELERLLRLLEAHPDMKIEIRGHTDDVGTEAANQALSEARARAVFDWLVAHGIDASRLRWRGFGESQPIAGNDTPEGRARNRRIEFVVISQ